MVLFNETGNTSSDGRSSVEFCFEMILNTQIQMSVCRARNSKYFIRLYQIDFPMVQSPLINWKLQSSLNYSGISKVSHLVLPLSNK